MNQDIRGLRVVGSHSLKPVIEEWQEIVGSTTWFGADGVAYWHSERTCLSTFAGAIWRRGGRVLEEVPTRRPGGNYGRVDMMFEHCRQSYCVESKQSWPTLTGRLETPTRYARNRLEQARTQLKGVARGHKKIGVVFVVPKVHIGNKARVSEFIEQYVDRVASLESTATAWVFPKRCRYWHGEADYADFVFPGVILLARIF